MIDWTEAEIKRFCDMYQNPTVKMDQIAKLYGISRGYAMLKASEFGVKRPKHQWIPKRQPAPRGARPPIVDNHKPEKHRRPCLSCERDFMSEGAHHRICNNCRNPGISIGLAPNKRTQWPNMPRWAYASAIPRARTCQYIEGEPRDRAFCGNPSHRDSYCYDHWLLCHRPKDEEEAAARERLIVSTDKSIARLIREPRV